MYKVVSCIEWGSVKRCVLCRVGLCEKLCYLSSGFMNTMLLCIDWVSMKRCYV